MTKETKKPRCLECDSTQVYYRMRSKDFVCRTCGHTFKKRKGGRKK